MDRKPADEGSENLDARPAESNSSDLRTKLYEDAYSGNADKLPSRSGSDSLQLASLVLEPSKEKHQFQIREDGRSGFGTLELNFKQMERAIGRLDPEIWESSNMSQSEKQRVTNLRQLARDLKTGKSEDGVMSALQGRAGSDLAGKNFLERYPERTIEKINAFLIGESANEIMKQSLANGSAARFKEPDRLLKEAVLSVKLGHFPSQSEFEKHSSNLSETISELRKQYPESREWSAKDHESIRKKSDEQLNTSEHWSKRFATATKNGLLACAAFITNGIVAGSVEKGVIPSLDLNMNGIVGESLIRGFQPRSLDDSVTERQRANVREPMAFYIRPPRVSGDFSSQRAGHIAFLNTETSVVNHNDSTTGIGKKEAASGSNSFKPEDRPYVLVPPGWNKITR